MPDDLELIGEPDRQGSVALCDLGRHRSRRRHKGLEQDPRIVAIADGRKRHGPAIDAPGDDDRQLTGEVDLPLEQQPGGRGRAFEGNPRRLEVGGGPADPDLAPAVVAADRRLEAEREAERERAGLELGSAPHLAKRGLGRTAASRKRRSASRCWVTASARRLGRAVGSRPTARPTVAATCSSSYVTTALSAASRAPPYVVVGADETSSATAAEQGNPGPDP